MTSRIPASFRRRDTGRVPRAHDADLLAKIGARAAGATLFVALAAGAGSAVAHAETAPPPADHEGVDHEQASDREQASDHDAEARPDQPQDQDQDQDEAPTAPEPPSSAATASPGGDAESGGGDDAAHDTTGGGDRSGGEDRSGGDRPAKAVADTHGEGGGGGGGGERSQDGADAARETPDPARASSTATPDTGDEREPERGAEPAQPSDRPADPSADSSEPKTGQEGERGDRPPPAETGEDAHPGPVPTDAAPDATTPTPDDHPARTAPGADSTASPSPTTDGPTPAGPAAADAAPTTRESPARPTTARPASESESEPSTHAAEQAPAPSAAGSAETSGPGAPEGPAVAATSTEQPTVSVPFGQTERPGDGVEPGPGSGPIGQGPRAGLTGDDGTGPATTWAAARPAAPPSGRPTPTADASDAVASPEKEAASAAPARDVAPTPNAASSFHAMSSGTTGSGPVGPARPEQVAAAPGSWREVNVDDLFDDVLESLSRAGGPADRAPAPDRARREDDTTAAADGSDDTRRRAAEGDDAATPARPGTPTPRRDLSPDTAVEDDPTPAARPKPGRGAADRKATPAGPAKKSDEGKARGKADPKAAPEAEREDRPRRSGRVGAADGPSAARAIRDALEDVTEGIARDLERLTRPNASRRDAADPAPRRTAPRPAATTGRGGDDPEDRASDGGAAPRSAPRAERPSPADEDADTRDDTTDGPTPGRAPAGPAPTSPTTPRGSAPTATRRRDSAPDATPSSTPSGSSTPPAAPLRPADPSRDRLGEGDDTPASTGPARSSATPSTSASPRSTAPTSTVAGPDRPAPARPPRPLPAPSGPDARQAPSYPSAPATRRTWRSGAKVDGAPSPAREVRRRLGREPDLVAVEIPARSWSDVTRPSVVPRDLASFAGPKVVSAPLLVQAATPRACAKGAYRKHWESLATHLRPHLRGGLTVELVDVPADGETGASAKVRAGCVRDVASTLRARLPGVHLAWGIQLGGRPGDALLDPRVRWPGAASVDVISLRVPPQTPWGRLVNDPRGLAFWSDFARAQGRRVAISDWSVPAGDRADGAYVQDMFEWLARTARSGGLAYDVHRLTPAGADAAASTYRRLFHP
ncbi:hypothetical protein [Agilicoccus flavus]|uniref:hypothetical protein n=1 Tax=Agilicoccus flavus TaxID=2775968 RepID=UPI001CF685E3|nr:hypothetical protein [Agilicoccus flavus]